MGSVWHATHLGLDVPCAVKFIEGEFAALPEAQARFEREAKAAASLRSPHVVQILDHGISEGRPYIAMELLDGEDLGKRIIRVGRLSPAETGAIVNQVCRALTKAHSLGIVHRDLKPDNIFLVRDDDREIAKVLDFGIAKSNAHGIDGSNTKTGAMLGTPYYMSPEQAQGTKAVDYRSDLWSLAVIVFQCVTGKLPFESEALGDLLVKIIVNDMPVPSHFGQVPPGFDEWWAKAASRSADKRFQSAKEFGESLQQVFSTAGYTDIMSAGSVRAALGGQQVPGLAQTPNPQRFGQTPPSAMAQSVVAGQNAPAGAPHANATTGAPIARTYNGLVDGEQPPTKSKNMGAIVAGIGGLVTVGLIIGGVAMFAGGKDKDKGAAGGDPKPTPTEIAKTADPPKVDPTPTPPTPPAPTVEAKAAEKTPEAKTQEKVAEKAPDKPEKTDRSRRNTGTTTKTAPTVPANPPTTTTTTKTPGKTDLGF